MPSSAVFWRRTLRDLHQDAGAVAHAVVGAGRAAVFQIAQDAQPILDDLVRLAALDVGDEADAAGVLVERRIVKTLRRRRAGIGVGGTRSRSVAAMRRDTAPDKSCSVPILAVPSCLAGSQASGAFSASAGRGRRADRNHREKGSLVRLIAAVAAPVGRRRYKPAPLEAGIVAAAIRTAMLS